ncbi:MAG: hypothetical protein Q9179_006504 [Wetmoreana sp. 5 TL-2023]
MKSFLETGFLKLQLYPGYIAEAACNEIDEAEYKKWLTKMDSDRTWVPLTFPKGPATDELLQTIEKNIDKCWERLGRRVHNSEKLGEKLAFFLHTKGNSGARVSKGHMQVIWIWVPLMNVSENNGLCGVKLESHQHVVAGPVEPLTAIPGEVLILDERLERHWPVAGGGIVLMRCYRLSLEPASSA